MILAFHNFGGIRWTLDQLISCVCVCPSRALVVVKCEVMWSLMRGFSSGGEVVATLPPRVQRDLICSLVRCGVGDSRQLFLSQVLSSFTNFRP